MTDKETKSNAPSAAGSSVVMVDKSSSSRHKPFRPTDLQDDGPVELHHKRSRAPAVPSIAAEKPKHVASKVSSKRASSPEDISMATIELDIQRADTVPSATQPIPTPVGPALDITGTKDVIEQDDSITEEITELRTAESPHREWDSENCIQECVPDNPETEAVPLPRKIESDVISKIKSDQNKKDIPTTAESEVKIHLPRKSAIGTASENITSTKQLTKKEISWTQSSYLDKVHLQSFNSRSVSWMLDRKASVGPCFRKTLPHGEPSGITICLPKKSLKKLNENMKQTTSGGISISVSKRYLGSNTKFPSDFEMRNRADRVVLPRKENNTAIKIEEDNCVNFLENLKGRLGNWRIRIKHALHL